MKRVLLDIELVIEEQVDTDDKAIFNAGGCWPELSDAINGYGHCRLVGIRVEDVDE